eukprot:768706-Hanusia_phi.AAC.4
MLRCLLLLLLAVSLSDALERRLLQLRGKHPPGDTAAGRGGRAGGTSVDRPGGCAATVIC